MIPATDIPLAHLDRMWPDGPFLEVAEATFGFLACETTTDGMFWPVGNLDWYAWGEPKSPYDQQPVEAAMMAEAALAACAVRAESTLAALWTRCLGIATRKLYCSDDELAIGPRPPSPTAQEHPAHHTEREAVSLSRTVSAP